MYISKCWWVLQAILLVGCATVPEGDPLWDATTFARTVQVPPGRSGNCEPVAWALRERHGGEVVYLSHPRKVNRHAVVILGDVVLDNGHLGYVTTWGEVEAAGWRVSYRPRARILF